MHRFHGEIVWMFEVFIITPPIRKYDTAPILEYLHFIRLKLMINANEQKKSTKNNIFKENNAKLYALC